MLYPRGGEGAAEGAGAAGAAVGALAAGRGAAERAGGDQLGLAVGRPGKDQRECKLICRKGIAEGTLKVRLGFKDRISHYPAPCFPASVTSASWLQYLRPFFVLGQNVTLEGTKRVRRLRAGRLPFPSA